MLLFLILLFQLKGGKAALSLHFDLIKLEPSEAAAGIRQEVYGGVSKCSSMLLTPCEKS